MSNRHTNTSKRSRTTSRRQIAAVAHAARGCEPLESRMMFCGFHTAELLEARKTQELPEFVKPRNAPAATGGIVWANRGSDNFNVTFGTAASAARQAVDAAFYFWNQVLPNLNQAGGDSQIDVTLNSLARGSGVGGNGGVNTRTGNKPRTSSVNIGGGTDLNGNGTVSDGEGYYIDPNPYDYSEFQGDIVNAFTGGATPGGAGDTGAWDLFSLVTVELQHAVGFDTWNQLAWSQDAGGFLNPAGSSHATAANDTVDSPGKLYTFDGGGIHALFTSNNGGGGGQDFGYAVHSARTGNSYTSGGVTYAGQDDTGVPVYFNRRRYLPSYNAVQALGVMYGYTVNPPQDVSQTFYAIPDRAARQVIVRNSHLTSGDLMEMRSASSGIFITLNIGTDVPGTNLDGLFVCQFSRISFDSVVMNGGGGNDILRTDGNDNAPVTMNGGAGDDIFDIGFVQKNLDLINGVVTVQGNNNGFDRIFVYDNLDTTADTFAITNSTYDATGTFNFMAYSGVDELNTTTGTGNDIIDVYSTPSGTKMYLNNAGGSETVNVGKGSNSGGARNVLGDIDIQNSPSFTTVNFDDTSDTVPRTVNTGTFGGIGNPFGYVAGLAVGTVYYKYNDTTAINLTLGTPNTGAGATVNVFETFKAVTISGLNGQQRNTINVGNTANGTSGILGDLRLLAIGFAANDVVVRNTNGPARTATLANFGSEYKLTGFTGGGAIIYNRSGFNSGESFSMVGGSSNESLSMTNVGDQGYLSFDGGGGFDSLSIDDRLQTIVPGANYLSPTNLIRNGGPNSVTYNTGFANIESLGFNAHQNATTTTVVGTPASIPAGQQTTLALGNNVDTITLIPQDNAGNQTITSNIGIVGGGAFDQLYIDDTGHSTPLAYRFANLFGPGTQNVFFQPGTIGLGTAGIENHIVRGGSGDDTFSVDQYSSGTGLQVLGNAGNDTMSFGNSTSGVSGITNLASFSFDGGADYDTFNLNNQVQTGTWSYSRNSGANSFSSTSGASYVLTDANVDMMRFNGGPSGETFNINVIPTGTAVEVNAAGGNDGLNLPGTLSTVLKGQILFDGEGGTNNINQLSNSSTTATTLHVTQNTIGATAGDNFFGPGGSVVFGNVQNMTLTLGSGEDTVFAAPNATAAMNLRGGSPTAAPGDTLNLALAGVTNYSVNPTNATDGNVTSDDHATLTYSSFETGPNVDDSAPFVTAIDFQSAAARGVVGQTITATFSEDVSSTIDAGDLQLYNLTTASYVPAVGVSFDTGTLVATFTFAGGVLPDGAYQAQIVAGATYDSFGNASPASSVYSFIYSAGTGENDTYRTAIDGGTLEFLVYLNDDITPAFVGDPNTQKIVLNGGEGDDAFNIDVSGISPGNVYVNGGAGTNSFKLTGSGGADNTAITAGSATINGGTIFTSNIASRSYDTAGEYDSLSIDGTTVSLVGADTRFGVLSIGDGAVAYVPTNGDSVLAVQSLNMQPTATLDLTDNDMHVESTDPATYNAIRALVTSAYDFGGWDGYGITSTAARDNPNGNTSLGMLSGDEFANNNGGLFHGASPASTDALLKYTYYGDVDFNGSVDVSDYNLIDFGFSNHFTGWGFGDADYSGGVDVSDYNLIDFAFTTQGGAL